MYTIGHIFSHSLPFLYLGVVFIYYNIFLKKDKRLNRITPYLLIALIVYQGVEIVIRLVTLNVMPFSTAFDALSFLAFSILVVYTIIELSMNHKTSGLFILGFALLLVIASSFSIDWEPETNELLMNPMFIVHAALNLIGYTALSLSAIYALIYIIQNRNMKKRKFNLLFDQMLSLDFLEKMSIRSVAIGIVVLGIGLVLSHYHLYNIFGKFWINDPKVIITDIIWLLYGAGYVISRKMKLPGKYMGYISLIGFLVLVSGGLIFISFVDTFHKFY